MTTAVTFPRQYGVYIDGDLSASFATRADAERRARIEADPDRTIEIIARYVEMVPTTRGGGGYVGADEKNAAVAGTESNAALICRSKCIDAAERLGVPFRE